MNIFKTATLLLIIAFTLPLRSEAALVTHSFQAVAQWSFGPPIVGMDGETISLTYTFESTTPDGDPADDRGEYNAITAMTTSIGAYTFTSNSGSIFVRDNDFGVRDQYIVSIGMSEISAPPVAGWVSNR